MRDEFGIKKAFLMASIGPAGPAGPPAVPWYFADSGAGVPVLEPFISYTPVLGYHVAIPDGIWPYLFFVDPDRNNAPSEEEVTRRGYNSPEPLFASLQMLRLEALATPFGLEPPDRPEVDRGIFDKTGTRLEFVAMSQDSFQTVSEQEVLYEYLTNDSRLKKFATVDSKDAVHSMYISNPRELLESLVPSNISLP